MNESINQSLKSESSQKLQMAKRMQV